MTKSQPDAMTRLDCLILSIEDVLSIEDLPIDLREHLEKLRLAYRSLLEIAVEKGPEGRVAR